MRYLVTGGAGFIGSHVCEALLARGDHVTCVDDFNDYYDPAAKERNIQTSLQSPRFIVCRDSITDFGAMQRVFQRETPERVIHLAARAGVRPSISQPLLYSHVNITGTLNLLELAAQQGIQNFVFASSSSVYGERNSVPFKETDPVDNPISPYAATKKSGELLCHVYSRLHNLPCSCLRFFTVYGPRGRPDMAPYKFTRAVMEGQQIEMYGDGSTLRDYTYVDDIVAGVIAAADKPHAYEIFNLGNSSPVTLKDFIATIEKVAGAQARIVQKPLQQGDVSKTYADTSKAQRMLSWQPSTPLEEGLRRTHAWLQHP